MSNLEIKKMSKFIVEINEEATKVFVEGFYEELLQITKNKSKLIDTFKNSFNPEQCYIALEDGNIVGMISYSSNRQRGINISKDEIKKNIGFFKGRKIYKKLNKECNKSLLINDHMIHIEYLTTLKEHRGKGIAKRLIKHLLDNLNYTEYVIQFSNDNTELRKLYSGLGFKEVSRHPEIGRKNKESHLRINMNKLTVVNKIHAKEYMMN
ncbi:MAG: GNAT family N-acetyltransferase [Clostridium sp.]